MTKAQQLTLSLSLVLAACADQRVTEPSVTRLNAIAYAKGGAFTTYAYTASGDITFPPANASAKTGSPFNGVSVANVTVSLTAPTGNIAACQSGNGVYTDTFGQNAAHSWIGTMTFHKTGTLSFNGSRVGGAEQIQFSAAD